MSVASWKLLFLSLLFYDNLYYKNLSISIIRTYQSVWLKPINHCDYSVKDKKRLCCLVPKYQLKGSEVGLQHSWGEKVNPQLV